MPEEHSKTLRERFTDEPAWFADGKWCVSADRLLEV